MFKVREVTTGSGKTAVQVVFRRYHRTEIIKHIGTGQDDGEISRLKTLAWQFIREKEGLTVLFPGMFAGEKDEEENHLVLMKNLRITGYRRQLAYDYLSRIYEENGFGRIKSHLLKDLVLIRVIEPASKRYSLSLLKKYFGRVYTENILYKSLPRLTKFKLEAEMAAVEYAQKNLNFDFSLVFYDVTTLYFETFKDDDLRKRGFSKDEKSGQPQILIALIVNSDGYPIGYQIFPGNKFEGHTVIPAILDLVKTHGIQNLTVVADAAMLSKDNIEDLEKTGLHYIVGARISNISQKLLQQVSTFLNQEAGKYFKAETPLGALVCDYSEARAAKDRSDRKKQIQKAQNQMSDPGKLLKKARFLKETTKSVYALNEELINKDKLLDGIKGYYTNLKDIPENMIITRYHDLWKIEKAFRIAKSDLQARPIFHHKRESIEAHILIVFLSLCISKSIEIRTKRSIKSIRDEIWEVLDIQLEDTLTGKRYTKRTEVSLVEY